MTAVDFCLSRRDLMRALTAVGVTTIGAGVLVACGSDTASSATPSASVSVSEPAAAPAGESEAASESEAEGDGATTTATSAADTGQSIALADVPVGEARVVTVGGAAVVVAQPTAGSVVAFSAKCTHQGVTVAVSGGLSLACPAHGSQFDATDGSATKGPATRSLAPLTATVEGDRIVIA